MWAELYVGFLRSAYGDGIDIYRHSMERKWRDSRRSLAMGVRPGTSEEQFLVLTFSIKSGRLQPIKQRPVTSKYRGRRPEKTRKRLFEYIALEKPIDIQSSSPRNTNKAMLKSNENHPNTVLHKTRSRRVERSTRK